MKIYIDADFKCHTENPDGAFREVVLSRDAEEFFANKCTAFIEGYRLKPEDETWITKNGEEYSGGEMITPWKNYNVLASAQSQYEADMAQLQTAYQEGVNSV